MPDPATMDLFMMKKKHEDVEFDIIPKNANVNNVRKHIVKKAPKHRIISNNSISVPKVEPLNYNGAGNPFENTKSFIMYYRAFLRAKSNNNVVFEDFVHDSLVAPVIIDLLQEHGCKTLEFLSFWISNYYTHFLKGPKMRSSKFTSMKTFKSSFSSLYAIYSRR
jgi:hypothetical protein